MSRAYVRRSYLRPKYPWVAGCTNPRHGSIECTDWAAAMALANAHTKEGRHEIRGGRKSTPTPIYEELGGDWRTPGPYPFMGDG
jgi:hypothetical protein